MKHDRRRDIDTHFPFVAILPVQFYDRGLVSIQDDGLRRLLGAILEDAVRTFQSAQTTRGLTKSKRATIREAEGWIYNTSAESPFSYCNVCEWLGIDPDALRKGLLDWRRRCQTGEIAERLPRRTSVRVETRIRLQRTRRRVFYSAH
jgi:hypothetical protein